VRKNIYRARYKLVTEFKHKCTYSARRNCQS